MAAVNRNKEDVSVDSVNTPLASQTLAGHASSPRNEPEPGGLEARSRSHVVLSPPTHEEV